MSSLNANTIRLEERDFNILQESDALAKHEITNMISNDVYLFTTNIAEPLDSFREIYEVYSEADVSKIDEIKQTISSNTYNMDKSFDSLLINNNNLSNQLTTNLSNLQQEEVLFGDNISIKYVNLSNEQYTVRSDTEKKFNIISNELIYTSLERSLYYSKHEVIFPTIKNISSEIEIFTGDMIYTTSELNKQVDNLEINLNSVVSRNEYELDRRSNNIINTYSTFAQDLYTMNITNNELHNELSIYIESIENTDTYYSNQISEIKTLDSNINIDIDNQESHIVDVLTKLDENYYELYSNTTDNISNNYLQMYNTSNNLIDVESIGAYNTDVLSTEIYNLDDNVEVISSHDYDSVYLSRYISIGSYYRFIVYRHVFTVEFNPTPWIPGNWRTIPPYVIKPFDANEPSIIEKNKQEYDIAYNLYTSAEIEYGHRGAYHAAFLAEYNCIASYYVINYLYENIDDTHIYIDSSTAKYEITSIHHANKVEGNAYIKIEIVVGSKETNRFTIMIDGVNHYLYYFDSILVNTDQLVHVF